jgi:hypothetical protein
MSNSENWIFLILSWVFGSLSGFLIDHSQRQKEAGRRLRIDKLKLVMFFVLGLGACVSMFFLMTQSRESVPMDFACAGLAGMKGFEVLTLLGAKVSQFIKEK